MSAVPRIAGGRRELTHILFLNVKMFSTHGRWELRRSNDTMPRTSPQPRAQNLKVRETKADIFSDAQIEQYGKPGKVGREVRQRGGNAGQNSPVIKKRT